jgi:hypothetical protein
MIRKSAIAVLAALAVAAPATALAAAPPSHGSVDRAGAHRFESSRHEASSRDRVGTTDRFDRSLRDGLSRDYAATHDER